MKKFILLIGLLFWVSVCFASPSNSITIPNSFSASTSIVSAETNANNNEIASKYNAHTHIDLTQVGTIISGTWAATTVGVTYGGTGITSAGGTSNRVLLTTDGSAFSVGQVDLTTMVTGALPVANGGNGGIYDSGWFAIAQNTSYAKTHSLGTTYCLITVLLSDASDGSTFVALGGGANASNGTAYSETNVVLLSTTSISIRAGGNICILVDNSGNTQTLTSGYARIIMMALE